MPLKSHREEASDQAPQVTCIRLTQGSSDDSVWVLEEGVGGTFLTIGSDPECEWQIRAAGMPAHAMSVLLVGGLVYVRSGPQRGVRLDGQLLSEDWKQVERDARIDVGLAQLEIKLGKSALLPSLRDVHAAARAQSHAAHATPHDLERSGMRRAPTIEARERGQGVRGSKRGRDGEPRPARHDPRRRSHPEQLRLDPDSIRPRKKSRGGFLYLVGLIVFGAAYALWVAWLDNVPWLSNIPWLNNIPRLDNISWLDSLPWLNTR